MPWWGWLLCCFGVVAVMFVVTILWCWGVSNSVGRK